MRGNQMLPNNHFNKGSMKFKNWFNQPMRALKRKEVREQKSKICYPNPLKKLRPVVRCCSMRYNKKVRLGRGFTKMEIEKAGMDIKYAISVGIAVDLRRKNKNEEGLEENVKRLMDYKNKLKFFTTVREARDNKIEQYKGEIMKPVNIIPEVKGIKVEEIATIYGN
ncbi:60S ribosomal protein L13 [Spraguea lophii 42_110]|uniref:60S ribosomal protein L13 n=1 Tax=Spraguea lophii (strain 42_110) TaxID=1358809 RepID=S7XVM9_SPRLO|nr:Chain LL0, 60S ribosomal protein L13 [Spraguea lophii 42_110]7QJH_KL0 Chain KL0, 60S ribosomal protein L13 [Spraguea lophii 42_110]7QJH_LL0 Chain LL0, 60S ribosomal protein L13 [Spraguea lophii 42_110]8BR3_LL0 Chain LL0, 60S ribosomal protein L13 [Spraguea lophii 42_110]8P5D_LL0 Chain LL0, 60S ribosomal protein L13 [Spraguea lophii 42_110]8P60_KL0 Chain KL0, 60S ribosomal protein L13 [Spraguea lophii 42_110]8P60_LL0 Chain LL0, 60S ribosomal protein L13 [Spraguea lophii 42_110]EPR79953.1 6